MLYVFNDLSDTRAQGFGGPLAITYAEIKSYTELLGVTLTPWEVETVKAMDSAFLEESYSMRNKK